MTTKTEKVEKAVAIVDPIKSELQAQSITEKALRDMEVKCLSLKMTDPNDKETYLVIEENRKQAKRTRIVIEKAYDLRIAEVNKTAKAYRGDRDAMVALVIPSETHLEAQAAIFEKEQERKLNAEKERLQAEENARMQLFADRVKAIQKIGARISDDETSYYIGEISISIIQDGVNVFEAERDVWAPVLQQFVDEALNIQKEKEAKEKESADERLAMAVKRAALDKKQRELDAKEAELKAAQDKIDKEEADKKQAIIDAERKARFEKDAELKIAQNKLLAAQKQAEAEKRAELLRPDKDKLLAFYTNTMARAGLLVDLVNVTSDEGKAILNAYIEQSITNLKELEQNTNNL